MKNLSNIIVLGALIILSCAASASDEDSYFTAGLGYSHTDTSRASGNPNTFYANLGGGIRMTDWLGFEVGAVFFEKLERDEERDADGAFEISFDRRDIYIAPVFILSRSNIAALFTKLGATYSVVEMSVKESFFGIKPSGEVSVEDSAFGYFFSVGYLFQFNPGIDMTASLDYLGRPEVFEQSERSLYISDVSVNLSLVF